MSIFPVAVDIDEDEERTEELPLLSEYAYDIKKNELKLNKEGKTYLVHENEALKIWIYKALSTERFYYTAYSEDYGSEHKERLTGHVFDTEILKLEFERFITEALMVNPYILGLDNFIFTKKEAGLEVSFDCTSIYGKETLKYEEVI